MAGPSIEDIVARWRKKRKPDRIKMSPMDEMTWFAPPQSRVILPGAAANVTVEAAPANPMRVALLFSACGVSQAGIYTQAGLISNASYLALDYDSAGFQPGGDSGSSCAVFPAGTQSGVIGGGIKLLANGVTLKLLQAELGNLVQAQWFVTLQASACLFVCEVCLQQWPIQPE